MNNQEIERLNNEILKLKNERKWFRDTYENRNILGILKDRFFNNLRRIKEQGFTKSETINQPNTGQTGGNFEENKSSVVSIVNNTEQLNNAALQRKMSEEKKQVNEQIFYLPKNRQEKLTEFFKVKPFFYTRYEKKLKIGIEKEVDIIIPIYNGLHFLKILIPQIFENSDLPFRLLLVNDCSPDKEIIPFLETLRNKKNVLIINNKTNLGFTGSVNKALKEIKNDVVLLNTDTEVPKNWLSRLFYPIFTDPSIATVTPFSNSATIASFPKFNDNPIFENLKVNELDAIFSSLVKYSNIEVPCGVGFCMAISKSALGIIGFLDEKNFPKGFGEEVDFSRRAKKKGFKNVFIPNLFVYHKHGGSFDSAAKEKLVNSHQQTLETLYPDFMPDVRNFTENSVQNHVRNFLLLLTCSKVASKTFVYFDHELGGGANVYFDNFVSQNKNENLIISISFVHPHHNPKKRFALRYSYKSYSNHLHFDTVKELKDFFDFIQIDELITGSLITYENLGEFMPVLKEIIQSQKCKSKYLIHDFHSICPNFNLMYKGESFCDIPELDKCETCLKNLNLDAVLINRDFKDLSGYRTLWLNFLSSTIDEIICFTPSVRDILKKTYPSILDSKIKIIPHFVEDYRPITIGIIGNIHSDAKGGRIIKNMVELFEKDNKYNVRIIVLGELDDKFAHPAIQKSGAYHRHILYDLVRKNYIDVVLIPSIWPETFSYTTAEAIMTGLPVFSYNLGGQADQVKKYIHGNIIEEISAESTLKTIVNFVLKAREKPKTTI